jgi:hypothetical protein
MPGFLLHLGASVACSHGGQAMPTVTSPSITIMGQPVVLQPAPYTIAACPFTTPAGNPLPCITAQWITAATRITSFGMPILLFDSQAICAPNGTPVLITASQTRVTGI